MRCAWPLPVLGSATLLFLSLVVPPGTSSAAPEAEKKTDRYENKDKGFSMEFKQGWKTTENVMGAAVIATSPIDGQDDAFSENVNVVVEELSGEMSLEQYFDANLKGMEKFFTDYKELKRGEATVGTLKVVWIIATFKQGQLSLKTMWYMLVHGKRGYVITCTATPDTFERFKPEFDRAAESFRLLEK